MKTKNDYSQIHGEEASQETLRNSKGFCKENFTNYDFPFENLVMEGGGNKGMAYVGAIKVLEDAGVIKNIKRVAGASAGAIIASLFAIGYTSSEIKVFMENDLQKIFVDHSCGYFSLLPNLITGFGWNPGKKLLEWFGATLKDATGDADITFKEVQEKFGRELCIVVTNLSQMSTEYCHPKTTPDMPIRLAVRMSSALPGMFQSVRFQYKGRKASKDPTEGDVYVDGGLLCNYPIHAFDGWWLSTKSEDSFFKKLQPLGKCSHLFEKKERFGGWNNKTVGIMLYSHMETELLKDAISKRPGNSAAQPPADSKLYIERAKLREKEENATKEHQLVINAVGRFMMDIKAMKFDEDGVVEIQELKEIFKNKGDFTNEDEKLLFGEKTLEEAFDSLDRDNDGKVTFNELMYFVEQRGVDLQAQFLGYKKKDIKTIGDFLLTLQTALSINVKMHYVEDRDVERTIGIDTDYIETTDFVLENCDKDFLRERGRCAATAFLQHYCDQNSNNKNDMSDVTEKTLKLDVAKDFKPNGTAHNGIHPNHVKLVQEHDAGTRT